MSFVRIATLAALSGTMAVLGAAAPASAQTVELKLSHFVPPKHAFHLWATNWAQTLEKESGGRIKITIYPNGQLVGPPNRQFDAARNGITDIAFSLHGVTPGRYAMSELANLPFTWPKAGSSPAITGKRMSELAPQYLHAEHQGLRVLFMTAASPIVSFSKVAVRKLDDYKGLKIRYAGVQSKHLIDALGAVPMLVPPPESQDALAKGIVDAAWFPHEAGLAYDLGSVVKYAIEPGLATATFAMVMNPAKYNSMPADLKALIDKHSGVAAGEGFGKVWEAAEKHGREILIKKGLEIVTLPEADVAAMRKRMQPHVESAIAALEKKGQPARKFYEEYIK
jgi:TRAP-type C4-dicarboxylate transport system substrate-binding protein